MATRAYIALTIQVSDVRGDQTDAVHAAEKLASAINTIFFSGGNTAILTSVVKSTEVDAVKTLAQYTHGFDA